MREKIVGNPDAMIRTESFGDGSSSSAWSYGHESERGEDAAKLGNKSKSVQANDGLKLNDAIAKGF